MGVRKEKWRRMTKRREDKQSGKAKANRDESSLAPKKEKLVYN